MNVSLEKRVVNCEKGGNRFYRPDICPKIAYECGRRGWITHKQLARVFRVSVISIGIWLKKHKNFKKMLEQGMMSNILQVENAMLKRAVGYEYKEEEKRREVGKDGVRRVRVVRSCHMAPDVAAAKFILQNRSTKRWTKDRMVPTKSVNLNIDLDASDRNA